MAGVKETAQIRRSLRIHERGHEIAHKEVLLCLKDKTRRTIILARTLLPARFWRGCISFLRNSTEIIFPKMVDIIVNR